MIVTITLKTRPDLAHNFPSTFFGQLKPMGFIAIEYNLLDDELHETDLYLSSHVLFRQQYSMTTYRPPIVAIFESRTL